MPTSEKSFKKCPDDDRLIDECSSDWQVHVSRLIFLPALTHTLENSIRLISICQIDDLHYSTYKSLLTNDNEDSEIRKREIYIYVSCACNSCRNG